MLAAEVIRAQGVEVQALFFETPFFTSRKARKSAGSMDLPFKVLDITKRHLEVIKRPKHGYGGHMNPCIDCHALMFRIAGEMLKEGGASFVVSGEVLGQRPMSQNKKALSLVASESGLGGLLLRPLSARLLPVTVPEEKGWVKRELLMGFQGRSRKPQIALAKMLRIDRYPSPAGGCLLTEKAFSRRLTDLLYSRPDPESREIELLKLGRHFKFAPAAKLVVGRNRTENEALLALSGEGDLVLTALSVPGPTALCLGDHSESTLELAATITAAYSDAKAPGSADVSVSGDGRDRILTVSVTDKEGFRQYMI
jgi:hypothetical protein